MTIVSRPDSVKAKIANDCLEKNRGTSILFIRWLMRGKLAKRIQVRCIVMPEVKDA